jgi:hypothetical protein
MIHLFFACAQRNISTGCMWPEVQQLEILVLSKDVPILSKACGHWPTEEPVTKGEETGPLLWFRYEMSPPKHVFKAWSQCPEVKFLGCD